MAKAITQTQTAQLEAKTGHVVTTYSDNSFSVRFDSTLYNHIISDIQSYGYQLRYINTYDDYTEAIFEVKD